MNETQRKVIADNIKAKMAYCISDITLSRKTGIDQGKIDGILNKKRDATPHELELIAKILNCSYNDLLKFGDGWYAS